jgi:hypothetical protein
MLKFLSSALRLFRPFGASSSGEALAAGAPPQMADLSLDYRLARESPWIPGIFRIRRA